VVLVAVAVIWGCARAWRIRLHLDDHGVTVRNYFRTSRFGWPEVGRITDGSVYAAAAGNAWAVRIVLRNGKWVTAAGTTGAKDSKPMMAAIRQAAENHGIPVDMDLPNLLGQAPDYRSRPRSGSG